MQFQMARRRAVWLMLGAVLLCAMVPLSGCQPKASNTAPDTSKNSPPASSESTTPVVTTLKDGTQIQRTPSDQFTGSDGLPWPGVNYNITYLNADKRGCGACHSDLASVAENVEGEHPHLKTRLDVRITTIQTCMSCHSSNNTGSSIFTAHAPTNRSLAEPIHTIHAKVEDATCTSCHAASMNGTSMQLWDVAKYDILHGITKVASVQGEFSFNQDALPEKDFFTVNPWAEGGKKYAKNFTSVSTTDSAGADLKGEALTAAEKQIWDKWTISVSGNASKPTTWTLDQLISQFESVTLPVKVHCAENPLGGGLVGAVNITGIPVSKILAAAGGDMSSDYVNILNASGRIPPIPLKGFTEAYLAYQIDGKKLSWDNGYPVMLFYPPLAGPANTKQVTGFGLASGKPYITLRDGRYYADGTYVNKPNVGILHFDEGKIVKTGEPCTFSGYADAFDHTITAMQFSLDNGQTWTTCPTPNTTNQSWVMWEFTYTPPANSAYVLSVRAVDSAGLVTPGDVRVMFNAKGAAEKGTTSHE